MTVFYSAVETSLLIYGSPVALQMANGGGTSMPDQMMSLSALRQILGILETLNLLIFPEMQQLCVQIK